VTEKAKTSPSLTKIVTTVTSATTVYNVSCNQKFIGQAAGKKSERESGRNFVSRLPGAYPTNLRDRYRLVKISRFLNDFNMVPQEGFEPPTPSLRMTCSTD
jgi:hypothetical protein